MKKIIIAVILILLICCIGVFLCINKKEMSKEEFIGLINSFENIPNVKIEEKIEQKQKDKVDFEDIVVIYRKDGKILLIRKGATTLNYTWSDSNTKESIMYDPKLKEYGIPEYVENNDSAWDNVEYKFIGYEFYKFTKCVVVELKYTDKQLLQTVWVDSKKGIVLKTIDEGKDSWGEEYQLITECTPTYGVVTDEDVQRPDLEGYTQIKSDAE